MCTHAKHVQAHIALHFDKSFFSLPDVVLCVHVHTDTHSRALTHSHTHTHIHTLPHTLTYTISLSLSLSLSLFLSLFLTHTHTHTCAQKREGIAKALLSNTASGGKQMFKGLGASASLSSTAKLSTFQAPNKTVFRHLQVGVTLRCGCLSFL